tara:strand:- start:118 stop:528 length:411 start_codon:yes stop_codon:yes gene_type:complete
MRRDPIKDAIVGCYDDCSTTDMKRMYMVLKYTFVASLIGSFVGFIVSFIQQIDVATNMFNIIITNVVVNFLYFLYTLYVELSDINVQELFYECMVKFGLFFLPIGLSIFEIIAYNIIQTWEDVSVSPKPNLRNGTL